jgi:type I restriction enzyme S subunit
MKQVWHAKTIGDVCEVIAGQSPEGKFYNSRGNGLPFYQGKKDFGKKFIEAPTTWTTRITKVAIWGDILMSVRAPVGPVNFATEEICIGRGLAAIRCGPRLDRDFLFYHLLHLQPEIAGKQGAVFSSINKSEIEGLPIAYPPLDEQQRIVGLLDEAFEGLATAKANAEKNLQNARALFASHLQSVFTHRGNDWIDVTLVEVLAVLRNGINCKQDRSGAGSKISRIESIWNARFDITRVGYSKIPETQRHKFLLKKGDVLFSHINSAIHVGKTALFDSEDEVVHGVNLLLMRTKSFIFPNYLDLYLKHIFSAGYWLRICKQSINQASVNQQDINRVPFCYPDLERQREIVEQMDALAAETQRLTRLYEQKLAALAGLKKSLLHQAFSGNL